MSELSTHAKAASVAPELPPSGRSRLRPLLLRALAFLGVVMVLLGLWESARGTALERLWVQDLTVAGAAALVRVITPDVAVQAQGSRLMAPGGGVNVLQGCEGSDVVALLCAAFLVFPMGWRRRLSGLVAALLLAYALNLGRVVGLFYAFRHDAGLFDLLHTGVAPLLMVTASGLFFHAWSTRGRP